MRNQITFSADTIKYEFWSIYDDSFAFIPISYGHNLFLLQTHILPSIIVDYDNQQAIIHTENQFNGNILPEIKKMDDYFSSNDFQNELFAQLEDYNQNHLFHIHAEPSLQTEYINKILNIRKYIELYKYESLFENDTVVVNLSTIHEHCNCIEEYCHIIPIKITKKSLHKVEKIPPLDIIKIQIDNYLLKKNNSIYKFGTASYFKNSRFKFPFAKCILEIKGVCLNHETKTYKLNIHMIAIQYTDNSRDIDLMSVPEKKL
jgi:hypothetical protein